MLIIFIGLTIRTDNYVAIEDHGGVVAAIADAHFWKQLDMRF